MAIAITEALTTIADAEQKLNLTRTEDDGFFGEWRGELPGLSEREEEALDELRRRYLYQRSQGQLLEGTVMLLLTSPLLAIAGFYDPPFRVRAEESVELRLEDAEEVLRGRIDVLFLLNQLWVVVLEGKKTALSVWGALPQALAYLKTNPSAERPGFAMVTNGDDILFVKLLGGEYAISRVFSPLVSRQELVENLRFLKKLGAIAQQSSDR